MLVSLLFISCLSVSSDEGFVQNQSVMGNGVAEVTVVPQGGTTETSGYVIYVKNLTNKEINIDWSKCSVSYFGQSYLLLVEDDVDYTEGYSLLTPIAPGVTDSFNVYSSGQLRIGPNRLEIKKIPTSESEMTIAIESGGVVTNYRFIISRKAQ